MTRGGVEISDTRESRETNETHHAQSSTSKSSKSSKSTGGEPPRATESAFKSKITTAVGIPAWIMHDDVMALSTTLNMKERSNLCDHLLL